MSTPGGLIIEPSPHRAGFYRLLRVPRSLEPTLRSIVGAKQSAGIWICPFDQIEKVRDQGTLIYRGGSFSSKRQVDVNPALYPYQTRGVDRALSEKRLLINFKPGEGKTPTAIEAMRLAGASKILIVCPAIVRDTWKQEFDTWWPNRPLVISETSEQFQYGLMGSPIAVTSYELMERNQDYLRHSQWDAIVFDESHYLKKGSAKRSRAVANFLKNSNPGSLRLFLTGTPAADNIIDLHNQVDLLYPELWGTLHEFKNRYCEKKENAYSQSGFEYFGVNPKYADELAERLGYISVTTTPDDIKGKLPPITFQAIRVRPSKKFNLREYLDSFDRRDVHRADASDSIRACGVEKIGRVIELVEEALLGGSTHISVMTHQRNTATEIAAALTGMGLPVGCITGADAHKKRHGEIARLAKEKRAIFVGTMHSIGIGINELVAFPDVIYAELDYRPDEVVQSMKRYHRVSGKANVRIRVLILEGTLEERVARAVSRKLKDQEMVLDTGVMAKGLNEELDPKMSDDEMFSRLQEAAAKMNEERDVYGG